MTLKEYCKANGYSFRQKRQGNRYYVTITSKDSSNPLNWLMDYRSVVNRFYPNAYMTSGGAYSATFMIGDVVEMLKGK